MNMNDFNRFIFGLMLAVLSVLAGCAFASDVDIGEDYHMPQGFSSILITSSDGTAIQNAVENIADGGTIFLSGDFKLATGSINIKRNLTIKGMGNAVLDRSTAPKKDRVIRCQGNITLENLTLIGGYNLNGGGVKLDGGQVRIISCDIRGNQGILGGGGIHSQAETLELTGCNISENDSMLAGGGISAIGGVIIMTGCKITGNTAQNSYGGGIGASGSTITLNSCQITGNSAPKTDGGGIALITSASLSATSCDISGNTANTASTSADVYFDNTSTYTAN